MCDYSLEAYRSRPARLGERYETHRFESFSIGFIAPGDTSTAVCMAYDTKLRLEGIPSVVQRSLGVSANEEVTFIRLENEAHHDAVRFANGCGGDVTKAWCSHKSPHLRRRCVIACVEARGRRGSVASATWLMSAAQMEPLTKDAHAFLVSIFGGLSAFRALLKGISICFTVTVLG